MATRSSSTPNAAIARDRQHRGDEERQLRHLHQRQAGEGAEHHQLALREVDGLGGLVDQHEAERDECVDAPLRNAGDQNLQKGHGPPTRATGAKHARGTMRQAPGLPLCRGLRPEPARIW